MKRNKLKPYVVSILLAFAVGGLSGIVTNRGMSAYEQIIKPDLTPPSAVFPIVWTILYILMGISAAMVWKSESEKRGTALSLYAVQLFVNGLWSILFFGFQAYFFSFLWLILLWVLIIAMIWKFYQVNRLAAYLQIPYLLWVTFAGYLNLMVWLLNR